MARPTPTAKRRRLAQELRQLRENAGLTIEEVAKQLEWSTGKVSKIENGKVRVLPRDVKFLLGVYGVGEGPEREVLLELARESRQPGWWQQYGDAIPQWFEVYLGLESAAASVLSYQGEYVPGLLQTEAYARAVHQAALIKASDAEIDRRVQVRIARQAGIAGFDSPRFWMVLNEAVLRRQVGGADVMRQQLHKIIEASYVPNVTLQVLPFSAGAHAAMDSPFTLLGFDDPGDSEIVFVEHPTGALYLEGPAEIDRHHLIFDHLRAASLSVEESRQLLRQAAGDTA